MRRGLCFEHRATAAKEKQSPSLSDDEKSESSRGLRGRISLSLFPYFHKRYSRRGRRERTKAQGRSDGSKLLQQHLNHRHYQLKSWERRRRREREREKREIHHSKAASLGTPPLQLLATSTRAALPRRSSQWQSQKLSHVPSHRAYHSA